MQRLVEPGSKRYEFWDLLKRSILIGLDDVLGGLGEKRRGKRTEVRKKLGEASPEYMTYLRTYLDVTGTHIFLVGVEKPEGEVTGLGGCSKLPQRASITS